MSDQSQPFGSGSAQGSAGNTDIVTALQGIIRQITAGNTDLQELNDTFDTQFTALATAIAAQTTALNTQLAALTAAILAVFPTAVFTGSFTLGAAATTVVNNGHVLSSSVIIPFPTNASAATLMGSAKALYISAKSAGVSFTVATASAGAAAGTETFSYLIVNL